VRSLQVTDGDVSAKPRYLQACLLRDAARPMGLLFRGRQGAEIVPPERGLLAPRLLGNVCNAPLYTIIAGFLYLPYGLFRRQVRQLR